MAGNTSVRIRKQYTLFSAIVMFMVIGLLNPLSMGLAILLSAGAVLLLKTADATTLMFFLLPYANIYKFSMGSPSAFSYLQILMIIRLFWATSRIKKNFLICFAVLCIINMIGSQMNLSILVKQLCVPLLIYFLLEKDDVDITQMTKSFALGVLTSSILAVVMAKIPALASFVREKRAYDISGEVYRFCGMTSDPNYYSVVVILAIVGIMILFLQKRLGKQWVAVAGILVYFGTKTFSKSFYLMVALVYIICIMLAFKKKKKTVAFAGIVVMFFVIGMILKGRIEVVSMILQRFDPTDVTTGRTKTWLMYLAELIKDPITLAFGHGISAELLENAAAHNSYIDILYYYGVFGGIIYVMLIVLSVKNKVFFGLGNLLPLGCILIMGLFLSYILAYDFALLMVYVLSFLQCEFISKPIRIVKEDLEGA